LVRGHLDTDKVVVDALKLRTEALARTSPAARFLNGGIKLATGAQKAEQGDTYGMAVAASSAMDKLMPTLYKSPVGVAADAVVIMLSDDVIAKQRKALQGSVRRVLAPKFSRWDRMKAACEVAMQSSKLAVMGRAMATAVVNVGRFGLAHLEQFSALKPLVGSLRECGTALAATRVGRVFGFLNRWIPLLNITWLAVSGKVALDVFRNPHSSTTTKALSLASLGLAGAVLVAGIFTGGLPFFVLVGGSILADLALAEARRRDAAGYDNDAEMRKWARNPGEGITETSAWVGDVAKDLLGDVGDALGPKTTNS
jgi:hypothetical protein